MVRNLTNVLCVTKVLVREVPLPAIFGVYTTERSGTNDDEAYEGV
jgi:hypothetical protein